MPPAIELHGDDVTLIDGSASLAKLKRYFTESRDLTQQSRTNALSAIDYYDSDQFTPDELAKLQARGQPAIVINRIKPAINGIIGVTEKGRSDPRCWPRNPGDDDQADAATDVLRYIADFNRFKRLKQDCFLDMLVPGTLAALMGVDEDKQVTITQVRWEEFFHDPRSRRKDFKDARFLGIAKWMIAASSLQANSAGYLGIPVNEQNGGYTFALSDGGMMVRTTSTLAEFYTIPPLSSVAFPIGTAIVVRNAGSAVLTIVRGSGVTQVIAGATTSKDVAMAAGGMATLILEYTNGWVISGVGAIMTGLRQGIVAP